MSDDTGFGEPAELTAIRGLLHYYDREGHEIALLDWAAKYDDDAYRFLEETQVESTTWVVTIWEGHDAHEFFSSRPAQIFGTAILRGSEATEVARYATEAEAREGHAYAVATLRTALAEEPM